MNKKYYWLKLKQDFFNNLRMKKLRSIAGGDTYTIIYLKMQLLSLQEEGILYYEGVEESFEQEIALLIDENVEDVKITINFLLSNNLMQEIEKGKYELIETKTCIGSETDKAEFMRRLRKNKQEKLENSNNVTHVLPSVTKCYTEKEIEKEIEKDKELEEEKERTQQQLQKLFIKCTGSTNLNAIEECISYLNDLPYEVIEVALKKTSEKNGGWKYAKTILQNWLKAGIKTIEQVEAEELNFKNKGKTSNQSEWLKEWSEKDD